MGVIYRRCVIRNSGASKLGIIVGPPGKERITRRGADCREDNLQRYEGKEKKQGMALLTLYMSVFPYPQAHEFQSFHGKWQQ